MWILTGPFDGPDGKLDFEKQKLLRPGTTYNIGRKNQDLILNNKKVSKDHATITVGEYSKEDVQDPSIRPSVTILHRRDKAMGYKRNGDSIAIGASTAVELQDGDVLCPVSAIRLKLEWRTLCCYVNKATPVVLSACASRGVNLVQTFQPDITHHVTPTLCLDTSVALSLISRCPLVTPAWLAEVNRLDGLGQGNPAPDFKLPSESQFKPPLDPTLPSPLQTSQLWKFDSKRLKTLSQHRIVILSYREEETAAMVELLKAAGATSSIFYVDAGRSTFRRHLSKYKDEKLLIILTHDLVRTKVTDEQWDELQQEAKNFDRHFTPRETVLEAIIRMDASLMSESTAAAPARSRSPSVLPDIIPNTLIDEPSIPPEQSKPKLRRLGKPTMPPSSPPRPPSPVEDKDSPPPPPRRTLTRLGGTKPAFMKFDNSISLDAESITPVVEQSIPPPSSTKPILGIDTDDPLPQRSSRLKRRAGTAGLMIATQSAPDKSEPSIEPPLKKFKTLFEESDPDRMSQMQTHTFGDTETEHTPVEQSPPTSNTQATGVPSRLHAVQEEEESTLSAAQEKAEPRGLKRKSERVDENEESETQAGPKPKKRAREGSVATQQSAAAVESPRKESRQTATEASKAAPGSQIGKPDVDNQFLKALASMKKGKKTEDNFDREFNNLRISKPELERDDHEKEWNLLEDFGDESNIRGNFMVVVEMGVYRKDANQARFRRGAARPEWEGKPDFKKFRKKYNAEHRPVVELTLSEDKDYGMGSAYWKGNSQGRSQEDGDQFFPTKSQTQSKSKTISIPLDDSDEEEDEFPVRQTGKRATQSQKPTRARGKTPRAQKGETKTQPLFLSDDEEMEVDQEEIDELDEDTPTLRSSRSSKTQKSRPAKKTPAAIVIDDDSDDGTAFKGFGAKAKGRSRR